MILPEGYEAHIAPRSSTFKNLGIILTNSVGVVDKLLLRGRGRVEGPVYALRDTHKEERAHLPVPHHGEAAELEFVTVDKLRDDSRGGFGSTGTK